MILWDDNIIWEEDRFDLKNEVLVENLDFIIPVINLSETAIKIRYYSNNEAILDVNAPGDVFLVFSDTYYPGWRAYIDGNETKIYRANGITKGILISEGVHEVEFQFFPSNFWLYFSISAVSIILIIAILFILYFYRKRKAKKLIINN